MVKLLWLDFYCQIYKGLCFFMSDMLMCVGCFDVLDVVECEFVFGQVFVLLVICCGYVECENGFVYLVFEVCCLGVSQGIGVEYDDYLEVIVLFEGEVCVLLVLLWFVGVLQLYCYFLCFVVENFEYMLIEEMCYNVVLWEVYIDDELMVLYEWLIVLVVFEEMVVLMCWMVLVLMFVEQVELFGSMLLLVCVGVFQMLVLYLDVCVIQWFVVIV